MKMLIIFLLKEADDENDHDSLNQSEESCSHMTSTASCSKMTKSGGCTGAQFNGQPN